MPKHDDGYLSPDCDVPNGMAMLTPLDIRALVFAKYRLANSSAAVWVSQQKAHAEQKSEERKERAKINLGSVAYFLGCGCK